MSPTKGLNRAAFISEGRPTLAPMGHVVFCLKSPQDCRRITRPVVRVTLTEERMAALREVNADVNGAIAPLPDAARGGMRDQWTVGPKAGDCEDYALTKRRELLARGWPASSLRIATARTAWGEAHAVLVARTKSGDFVLDNLQNAVLLWNATGLRFVAMQSSADPRFWRSI